ncbi:MAG: FKBP-type peptidyl-prolyl cis-trans isomerase [Flammeovirgaceae bacterium]|jgi:FKBP-type peptidyl-prolyl cis-trans isomerase
MNLNKLKFALVFLSILGLSSCKDDPEPEILVELEDYLTANDIVAEQDSSSALKYIIDEIGTGTSTSNQSIVTIKYTGKLTNGRVFGESTTGILIYLPIQMEGLKRGISFLKEGGKATFYIPSDLGYGANGSGSVPPNADLIFEIEVVKIENLTTIEEYIIANNIENVLLGDSGLKYTIQEEGTGESPTLSSTITVKYTGKLTSDRIFDSSDNKPVDFRLTNLINGWKIGFQLLKKGSKATLYVPYELAYGTQGSGSIPPNADLIFEVELVDFR